MLITTIEKTYLLADFADYNVIKVNNKTIISKTKSDGVFLQVPNSVEICSNSHSVIFKTQLSFQDEFNIFISTLNQILKLKKVPVFTKRLKIAGLGYKILRENDILFLSLGYSKIIKIRIPEDIFNIIIKKRLLVLESSDRVKLGDFVSKLCRLKRKDIYKGKGLTPEYKTIKLKPIRKK